MVDVFDRHEVRFDPRLAGCSKFVRHSDYATLEAQLAERVKVKTLEWTRGWVNAEAQTEIGQYTITYRRDGSFEWGIGILKGWASSWDEAKAAAQADYERRILSALASHPRDTNTVDSHETANVSDKPEGQQPVAWLTNLGWIDSPSYTVSFEGDKSGCDNFPVYTRPSEQAVTEAGRGMLRIVEEIDGAMNHGTWRDENGMRLKDTPEWVAFYNVLKDAMEAGG